MGGVRWTDQQLRDFFQRQQMPPAEKRARKVKRAPSPDSISPQLGQGGEVGLLIELGMLLPTRNASDRAGWRARRRHKLDLSERIGVLLMTLAAHPIKSTLPWGRAEITVTRMSSQEPDSDGNVGSIKGLLDVLQVSSSRHPYGLGVIVDDSPRHLTQHTRWAYAQRRRGRTTIEIWRR